MDALRIDEARLHRMCLQTLHTHMTTHHLTTRAVLGVGVGFLVQVHIWGTERGADMWPFPSYIAHTLARLKAEMQSDQAAPALPPFGEDETEEFEMLTTADHIDTIVLALGHLLFEAGTEWGTLGWDGAWCVGCALMSTILRVVCQAQEATSEDAQAYIDETLALALRKALRVSP